MAFLLRDKRRLRELADRVQATSIQETVDNSARIAQEVYRKNVELAHTNQTLSLLRAIDNLVLEPNNDLNDLAQGIATALVENSNYLFSVVFVKRDRDDTAPMQAGGYGVVRSNVEDKKARMSSFNSFRMYADDSWFDSKDYSEIVDITSGGGEFLQNTFKSQANEILALARGYNCQTVCVIKLMARKNLVGAMMVGLATAPSALNVNEIEYLGRIGEASGIALDNKLLFEENQQVLHKLELSNKKLQALDEAKDEFISMASHQLRTPLTSIKGYLSLVLEGDVGDISDTQRNMLSQAFTSSQRMVYLISDLLNVSRLRTGKFIIEPKPTYLPDVITEELQQVFETAKARKVSLNYDKPTDFPKINLDETKIRQVIMNFVDNAIYYTPANGIIEVKLLQKPKSIEFTVTDNGIGVPKSEQHKLFTKFYRAGNARKARPDGTGLGLFMAKKVIVASGGSLIFKTQEGKGSTFGFNFPLENQSQLDNN